MIFQDMFAIQWLFGHRIPRVHRLLSKKVLWRLRVVSFLFIFNHLLLLVAFGFLVYGISMYHHPSTLISGCIFTGVLFLMVLKRIMSPMLCCPICLGPPLYNRACSKHRNVDRLLGSYKLKIAASILLCGYFTCPYCGEKTVMRVRSKRLRDH